jgi:putative hemolysin
MEILLLAALIVLNGLFAMSEMALVTTRRARLQRMIDDGDRAAELAAALHEQPTKFLSTVQIGITSIGILSGIVGEAALSQPLEKWLVGLGMEAVAADWSATGLVVVVITFCSIVFGELVPKRIGQQHPESIARMFAFPLQGLSILAKPTVRLLTFSTDLVLRLLGVKSSGNATVTEDEIHAMLEEGSETGVIEAQEHAMVRNVFRLDDRQIASLMVPRGDIAYLDVAKPLEENLKRVEASEHSRMPVVRGDLSQILGVQTARQLLVQTLRGHAPELTASLQPPVFVPESLTGMELLQNFRSSGTQLAFVIDEYGEVQGMVTLQDVMEAITGEFKPRRVEDSWAVRREDGSWLLDGLIPVPELKDRLDIGEVPEEERGRYHTLAGMLLLLLGRLPNTGDRVDWEDWRFEIVDLDGKRIDKVLASRKPAPPTEETSA